MRFQPFAKRLFISFALLAFLFSSNFSLAQRTSYELGLNPSSLKWKQIKTDKVQVIFPHGLELSAQRVANLVHFLSDSTNISIGKTSGRVSIILQTQTTIPNGFVSLTPFRSEFFMTPPQFNFSGSTNWADLLTIHEYRHVKQALGSKKGVTKAVSCTVWTKWLGIYEIHGFASLVFRRRCGGGGNGFNCHGKRQNARI